MSESTVTVQTPLGTLRGVDQGAVHVFRGIRYAEAPVGPLRFQPPQPVASWPGTRDATRFGPIPPQSTSRLSRAMGDFEAEQDEDCLALNVWRPAKAEGPLPVLFWIHGGAFSSGAGSLDWYSGAAFARRHGVLVVTINYRLGPLGWLRLPGVSDGNLGLRDQIAALRWVKDNIASFGGDPDAVTVAGQSAGGLSIALMMGAEECRGLFARAILQSPPLGITLPSAAGAEETASEFMAILGLDATQTEALRDMPVDKQLAAARTLGAAKKSFGRITTPIGPHLDGGLIPRSPLAAAAEGTLAGMDILIGTTREEMMAFFRFDPDFESATDNQVEEYFGRVFGGVGPALLDETQRRRPGGTRAELVSEAESAARFERPSLAFAEALARHGRTAFAYRFDWQSPLPGLDSCHCLELPFVFGNPEDWAGSPMIDGADEDAFAGLSAAMQGAWAAFTTTGSPDHPHLPQWPPYDATQRWTMCFDDVVSPVPDAAGLGWRLPVPPSNAAKREH